MNTPFDFVTCDLLDDNPDASIAVLDPLVDGKPLRHYGKIRRFCGQIVTVKCFEDNSKVKELLATDGKGKVLVVDGGGSVRCALLGDQIAQSAVDNGWAGVIVYGCVRDVDAIGQMDLGVVALASAPKKSVRKGLGETDVALRFGGVEFCPDQYVYADNNGILVCDRPLI